MIQLGSKFDEELEKAKKGEAYNFEGIFKAQKRLVASMVCPACQVASSSSIVASNQNIIVPGVQRLLGKEKLANNRYRVWSLCIKIKIFKKYLFLF